MRHVHELDGLRGLMALWVILGHLSTSVDIPAVISRTKLYNAHAVDVFILLSGFAIATMLLNRQQSYRTYITTRFFRIFPIYLFYLLISVALARFALDTWLMAPVTGYMKAIRITIATATLKDPVAHFIAHLPALHGIVPRSILPYTDTAYIGQAWSISLEWQFYLVAPILIACVARPSQQSLLRAGLLVGALLLLGHVAPIKMAFGFLGGGFHLMHFYLGIGSAVLYARFVGTGFLTSTSVLKWLLMLCCAASALVLVQGQFMGSCLWLWTCWIILAGRARTSPVATTLASGLSSPWVLMLGRISYSLYLSHMLIIIAGIRLLSAQDAADGLSGALLLLAATLPATLIISLLTYKYIEAPFNNYGKALGRASEHRVAA